MGSEKVILPKKEELKGLMIDLLDDVRALDKMLQADVFEKDTIRIGAEQELCLVDHNWKPAMKNLDILEALDHDLFTTELAKFNMEVNVDPLEFKGKCLSQMEKNISDLLKMARAKAKEQGTDIILTGILPTIRKGDLVMDSLTPFKRYKALVTSIAKLRGKEELELNILGMDELRTTHNSPLPEACNTGFQVHLQVKPEEFARKYNIAQAIAGPALAIATNSPILFGKRLWHETRIALFQQAIDVRTAGDNLRDRSARVMFGTRWVENSILEIYKEDIMRFRVLLGSSEKEDAIGKVERGETPNLYALGIHNSTVYRWNRPCYGVSKGIPHLRIENRVLPSGPTVKDEMANAALWLGLMNGLEDHYPDVRQNMAFDRAKANFLKACRNGMNTKFYWMNGSSYYASDLLINELLPIAKEGLLKANVDKRDVKRYMDILEGRAKTAQTGSQWMLNSYGKLLKETSQEEARVAITSSIVKQQNSNKAVHEWELASLDDLEDWQPTELIVEDFMQTELFTVEEDDIIPLVADIMDWQTLRYVPVENEKDELIGLVTSRHIRRYLLTQYRNLQKGKTTEVPTVKELMITNPITIAPRDSITKAIDLMHDHGIGCLPVVDDQKHLLGIITEKDYMKVVGRLTYQHFQTKMKQVAKKQTKKVAKKASKK